MDETNAEAYAAREKSPRARGWTTSLKARGAFTSAKARLLQGGWNFWLQRALVTADVTAFCEVQPLPSDRETGSHNGDRAVNRPVGSEATFSD